MISSFLALEEFSLNEISSQTSVKVNKRKRAQQSLQGTVEEWVDRVREDKLLCPLEVGHLRVSAETVLLYKTALP